MVDGSPADCRGGLRGDLSQLAEEAWLRFARACRSTGEQCASHCHGYSEKEIRILSGLVSNRTLTHVGERDVGELELLPKLWSDVPLERPFIAGSQLGKRRVVSSVHASRRRAVPPARTAARREKMFRIASSCVASRGRSPRATPPPRGRVRRVLPRTTPRRAGQPRAADKEEQGNERSDDPPSVSPTRPATAAPSPIQLQS